jgi:hypothetical protein
MRVLLHEPVNTVGDVLFSFPPTRFGEVPLEPVAATLQALSPKDFHRRDKIDFQVSASSTV